MIERDVRVLRSMPLWLVREYLEELGGRAVSDTAVEGDGWQAVLSQMEDFQVGSLRCGQVRLEVIGEAETLERLRPRLDLKFLRAGG
jgi:hypothetical protein